MTDNSSLHIYVNHTQTALIISRDPEASGQAGLCGGRMTLDTAVMSSVLDDTILCVMGTPYFNELMNGYKRYLVVSTTNPEFTLTTYSTYHDLPSTYKG